MQPYLRFREYSDDLNSCLLETIADVKGGKRIPKGYSLQRNKNPYPYITVSDMTENSVDLTNIKYVPPEVADKISNYKITVDDIFISVAGTLGVVGRIPNELNNANLTENANKLTNIKCNQTFLFQYLKSNKFTSLINSTKTTNAQPKLAIYAIKGLEVCLPSNQEQQKIANFLSDVDKKISLLEEKHLLFKQYKKGVMQKVFSQDTRFKDENGNNFPDWQNTKFGKVFERVTQKNKENNQNVLTISAQRGLINQQKYFNKSVSAKDVTGYYLLNNGDFAYNKSYSKGYPMGAIKRLNNYDKGVVSTLYICFKSSGKQYDAFWEQYFEAGLLNREISKIAQEGARNHGLLNVSVTEFFRDITVHAPSEKEQVRIADFLEALDKKLKLISQQIEQTQTFKKGLLQQMFV